MTSEPISVVQDLAVVLLIATPMALLSHYLRQPMIIAYILAGMIIGPYTPPTTLVSNLTYLTLLAELGIVFLLLAVGLEFPMSRLRAVGRRALIIALVEAMGTFSAGVLVGLAFGFSTFDALFVGLAISVTSTVVVSRVLEEIGVFQRGEANLVLAITIIEDVVTVSALGILQSIYTAGGFTLWPLVLAVGLVVLFIALTLTAGLRVFPPLINKLAAVGKPELLLIGVLGLTFGLAILSSAIGISVATGAFFAGVMVAESKVQAEVHRLVSPLKELFGAIFFVSMGALMDIGLIPVYLLPLIALVLTAVVAKLLYTYYTSRALRVPPRVAKRTALTVSSSGGEMALVVANGGDSVGATSAFVLPLIGAITIITTFISPYLIRFAWRRASIDQAASSGPPGLVPDP